MVFENVAKSLSISSFWLDVRFILQSLVILMQSDQTNQLVLYSYYRSSASWRIRIVLELKALPYKLVPINLLQGEQLEENYLKINANGALPCIQWGGITLSQSLAIFELIESKIPGLIPKDPYQKAKVQQN